MNKVLISLVVVALLAGSGCSSRLAGQYSPSVIAKNPWILSLESNDTYTWHQEFSPESVVETGRWWKVTANVIVLLPDSPRSSQRFARLNKKSFRTVTFSGELRTLIDGSSQKSNGEATSGTAGFEASYP